MSNGTDHLSYIKKGKCISHLKNWVVIYLPEFKKINQCFYNLFMIMLKESLERWHFSISFRAMVYLIN